MSALVPAAGRRAWVLGAALLIAGCAGDTGTTPTADGGPAELVKSGGDQQSWYFGNPLPAPYQVVALDSAGRPASGVVVTWAVASGAGSVDPTSVATDGAGAAAATHTLGPSAAQSVTASVPGLAPVTFVATATSPPTSAAVTVGNNSFSPRDVIIQVGGTATWTWSPGAVAHNVTYTTGPSPRPSSSPTQDAGTHSNTFTVVARYEYACTIHAGMEGTVTVVN